MEFRLLLSGLTRSQRIFLLFSLLGIVVVGLYLSTIIAKPLAVVALSLRLVPFLLGLTAFLYWRDWRALPLTALFFLMTVRLLLISLISSGYINSTPLLSTLNEMMGLCITLLTVWVMIYTWGLFSTQKRLQDLSLVQSEIERDLQTMLDYSYDWIVWHGVNGKCKMMSTSCERITGYTREEFAAQPELFSLLVVPEDRERVVAHYEKHTIADSLKSEIEYRLRHKNGEIRWIWHQCQSVHDQSGSWAGRLATNRDVTRIKEKGFIRLKRTLFHEVPLSST